MVQDILERTKKLVWPEIEKYLKDPSYPKQFSLPKKFSKEINLYWQINRVYPERKGKYLRPTAVLLIAEAMGAKTKDAIKTAAAMQLSEEWILIHDDIEDHSDVRRGAPTLHKLYGTELAINAGDSLHMIMWKIISDIGKPEINEEFYKMLFRTALGQGVEQIWTNDKKKLKDDEYYFIADSKSAYYSIAGPMRLGAIIAGARKSQIDKLTNFGLHLGRCFQLVDDILDIDQDKVEGKSTLALTKGKKYARREAEKEKELAREIFDKDLGFLSRQPARSQLEELTNFILERKY
jgi:geranylgeranyl diphosphate synthase type II